MGWSMMQAGGRRRGLQERGAHGVVLNDERADWREAWALFPATLPMCGTAHCMLQKFSSLSSQSSLGCVLKLCG